MKYNYSIIIPHKNIPDLLMRCLHSIPNRKDVQIIVVDDNSVDADTYFEKYPELSQPNVEFYPTKEGKGAGHARNLGLTHAKGEWIIFADADDFFTNKFSEIIDKHIENNHEADVIYYDFKAVYNEAINEECSLNEHLHLTKFESNIESIRYTHLVPWAKIIRHDLIVKNNCKFEEVQWGNDTFFNMMIGVLANKIETNKSPLYIQTKRKNSLTSKFCSTKEELYCRIEGTLKSVLFAESYGYNDAIILMYVYIVLLIQRSNFLFLFRVIKSLNSKSIVLCYKHLTNNANLKTKLFIKSLFILGIILPTKKIAE